MALLFRQSTRWLAGVSSCNGSAQLCVGVARQLRGFTRSGVCCEDDEVPASKNEAVSELVDPAQDTQPKERLAIPLKRPIIPGGIPQVLTIADKALLKQLKEGDQAGGQVMVAGFFNRISEAESPTSYDDSEVITTQGLQPEQLHETGTLCLVKKISYPSDSDDSAQISLQGYQRVQRTGLVHASPFTLQCRLVLPDPYNAQDATVKAMHQELVQTMKTIFTLAPIYVEQMRHIRSGDFHDMARFTDVVVALVNPKPEDAQAVLEATSVPQRMELALSVLKKEVQVVQIQKKIATSIEENVSKDQRRWFMMEQMKYLQKELGITKDDRQAEHKKFEQRFAKVKGAAPEEAVKAVEEELDKILMLEPSSAEYNVSRNYLEWLTSIPYGVNEKETFDIQYARACLDEEHFGMRDVKERILEFIAVGKLKNDVQGKIICLVGPPGVGKTSIGKSVAKALNRKFYRFAVGGLSDPSEIKGHRRTYIGSMPGKMIQCLKQVQCCNPMVLIDEIDKLGRGLQGDPASALLEMLDPQQNAAFRDQYVDVPVDLTKVLFVCTANVLDTIPRPLLDRMEVLEVSGYTALEKTHIAREYIEKIVRTECSIPDNAAQLTDGGLQMMIDRYCRESGVRSLKKHIERLYRKVAYQLVTDDRVQFINEEVQVEVEDEVKVHHPTGTSEAGRPQVIKQDTAPRRGIALHTGARSFSTSAAACDASAGAPPKERKKKFKTVVRRVPRFEGDPIIIDENNLEQYLRKPPFDSDRFYARTPAGVVMGLAWTHLGGSTLYVESSKVHAGGTASVTMTGQLGDVMKESVTIAQTVARKLVNTLDSSNTVLEEGTIHLHVPEGATPKDGPSAGCTMVSALLSLAFNTPVIPDVAMTGEMSLSGRVLPIGGVREKVLAARRSSISVVILPDSNRGDWNELDDDVREGIEVHFVRHYIDIFPILFPELADKHAIALNMLRDTVDTSIGKADT